MAPEAKKSTFNEMIAKGSLKLRKIAEMTVASSCKSARQNWRERVCKEHENEMIEMLMDACKSTLSERTNLD